MQRRKLSREYKLEAVKLVRGCGVGVAQAARDLDVHQNVLRSGTRPAISAAASFACLVFRVDVPATASRRREWSVVFALRCVRQRTPEAESAIDWLSTECYPSAAFCRSRRVHEANASSARLYTFVSTSIIPSTVWNRLSCDRG